MDNDTDATRAAIPAGFLVQPLQRGAVAGDIGTRSAAQFINRVAALGQDGETRPDAEPSEMDNGDAVSTLNTLIAQARALTAPDVRHGDLLVSYTDIRECLALILGVTTDPQEILSSLNDAVSNNLGE